MFRITGLNVGVLELLEHRTVTPRIDRPDVRQAAVQALRLSAQEADLVMPIMDAMPAMEVSVAGRRAEAPANAGCWSKAADDLVGAALEATTPKSH